MGRGDVGKHQSIVRERTEQQAKFGKPPDGVTVILTRVTSLDVLNHKKHMAKWTWHGGH